MHKGHAFHSSLQSIISFESICKAGSRGGLLQLETDVAEFLWKLDNEN